MTPSILVIDDDASVRRLLVAIFSREGFEVTEAADGNEAIPLLDAHEYDGILLDVMMPNVGGRDVLKHLASGRSRRRNVIVLTAAQPRYFADIDRGRVHCVIRKPFDLGELREQVQLLRRHEVLVVEDNPADQYLIDRSLTEGGYVVTMVSDGREALRTLGERDFNAVVVDVRLPIISGYDVLDAISTKPGHPPTVVLSLLDNIDRKLTADVILQKPQGVDQLVPILDRLTA
ncbi:MAG: response regulator [Acidobacteriota bacterium]